MVAGAETPAACGIGGFDSMRTGGDATTRPPPAGVAGGGAATRAGGCADAGAGSAAFGGSTGYGVAREPELAAPAGVRGATRMDGTAFVPAGALPIGAGPRCGIAAGAPVPASAVPVRDLDDGLIVDAGGGAPAPGRAAGTWASRGVSGGGVPSTGALAATCAGTRTRWAGTGRAPASVSPLTAVIAPGTRLFAYVDGGWRGRSLAVTPCGWLNCVQHRWEQRRQDGR